MTATILTGSPNVKVNGVPVSRVEDTTDGVTESDAAGIAGAAVASALNSMPSPITWPDGSNINAANGLLSVNAPIVLPGLPTANDQAATKQYVDESTGAAVAYPITVEKGGTGANNVPTPGNMLVANGTTFTSVSVSGDVTLSSNGLTTVVKLNGNNFANVVYHPSTDFAPNTAVLPTQLSANLANYTSTTILANTYTSMVTTKLGVTGSTSDAVTNTTVAWSNLPVGYSSFMSASITANNGAPITSYGYFTKVANRDVQGGWGGIWVGYGSGQNYVGRSATSNTFAQWDLIWTDANFTPNNYTTTASLSANLSNYAYIANLNNTMSSVLPNASDANTPTVQWMSHNAQSVNDAVANSFGSLWTFNTSSASQTLTPANGVWLRQFDFTTQGDTWHRQSINGSAWSAWEKYWTTRTFNPNNYAQLSGANFTGKVSASVSSGDGITVSATGYNNTLGLGMGAANTSDPTGFIINRSATGGIAFYTNVGQAGIVNADGSLTWSFPISGTSATFSGTVTLAANPTANLQAATKQYVDAQIGGGTSPTGPAGGVLSGTYPNPGFASNPTFSGNTTSTQFNLVSGGFLKNSAGQNIYQSASLGGHVFDDSNGNPAPVSVGSLSSVGLIQAATGGGDALSIGNDTKLVDINVADTFGLQGLENSANGGIQFGLGGPTLSGNSSYGFSINSNVVFNGAHTITFNNSAVVSLPTFAGTCSFTKGNADAASLTQYDVAFNSWWGIGFPTYNGTNYATLDTRTGTWLLNGDVHCSSVYVAGGVNITGSGGYLTSSSWASFPQVTVGTSGISCSGNTTAFGMVVTNDYYRINGQAGLYFSTYGSGWHMQDSTYVRTYLGGNHACMASDFVLSSDAKLKDNVVDFVDRNARLRPRSFRWIANNHFDIGFIAQEVEESYPELIGEAKDADANTVTKVLSYSKLTVVLAKQINDLQDTVKYQQQVIDELTKRISHLESQEF